MTAADGDFMARIQKFAMSKHSNWVCWWKSMAQLATY